MHENGLYNKYIKRILDVAISSIALIALSPVLLCTAVLIRIKLGAPILFKQPRPGKDEKIFHLYKFRSMTNEKGEDGRLLPDAKRLTKFGKFLRASSIDELPELINIIKGDMSIVGPRPLSIYYLPHYPANLRRRHEVRPGLTGLAQVHGRSNLQWDERFAMDIRYVENVSFALDLKIVADTVLKVLKRSDVTVRGSNQVLDYGTYCVMKEHDQRGNDVKEKATYPEIGSYFWLESEEVPSEEKELSWLPQTDDSCFAFSGRNAMDVALRDILNHKQIDTVYVPSYCCISMLQAFVDRGMKIEFYRVWFEDGKFRYIMPEANSGSLVLIMSYFGFETKTVHVIIEELHLRGATVIEDITHSLLRKDSACAASDYIVASLRKWFAIPAGGWVGKRNGTLSEKPSMDSNHAIRDKIAAMREKYQYLAGAAASKEHFLQVQATFENDLIHVDRMLKIDDTSLRLIRRVKVEDIVERRRKNAQILLDGLLDLKEILSVPEIDLSEDVPLFLPILMETNRRDRLREYLVQHRIYCPIHWPEVMGAPEGVRENELSLICDQRYTEGDMLSIVDAVHAWYEQTGKKAVR